VPPRRHYSLLRDRLLREEFVDLQFLTFDARLVAAARGSLVPVYERA
jgi:hypothetical protein